MTIKRIPIATLVESFITKQVQVSFLGGLLLAVALPCAAAANAETRQVVHRHFPAAATQLQPVGQLPGTNTLQLAIGLPLRNPTALDALLQQLQDPAVPTYRHYLTPDQFAERFGPTKEDYAALIAFAKVNRFTVTATSPNRLVLSMSAYGRGH